MNGDNFRMVCPEVSALVLEAHFGAADIPVDACAPVSLYGDAKPIRKLGYGTYHPTQAHRKAISEAHIERACRRLGISREERQEYREIVRRTGLSAAEALRIVRESRGRSA